MIGSPRLVIVLALVGAVVGTLLGWDRSTPEPVMVLATTTTTIKVRRPSQTTATTMTAHSVPTLAPDTTKGRDNKRDKLKPKIENRGRDQDKKQDKHKDIVTTTTSTTTSSTTSTTIKETTTT